MSNLGYSGSHERGERVNSFSPFDLSSTSDNDKTSEQIYIDSKNQLKDDLIDVNKSRKDESPIIIALGRKGIKLYEYLFYKDKEKRISAEIENEKEMPIVVSEHALPFICKDLCKKKRNSDFCVMDDALYYGGSAKGIIQEINAFKKIYDIKHINLAKVKFYAAIQTKEVSLDLIRYIDAPIKAKMISINGYSHYFVRRLNEEIRSLENSFEIEYPIVTYTLDKTIGKEKWREGFKKVFGSEAIVYLVEHYESYSINIVFKKTDGCTFNKIRIFPSNSDGSNEKIDRIKVVCMAPHSISDEDDALEHLFDGTDSTYQFLWNEIYERCHVDSAYLNSDNIYDYLLLARRRCVKTMVMMANYLRSFNIFVRHSRKIEEVMRNLDLKSSYQGVDDKKDLYYLLGNSTWSKDFAGKLNEIYDKQVEIGRWMGDDESTDEPTYPIFENINFFPSATINLMEEQNEVMIDRTNNLDLEEALSVLFYNQDAFFEKRLIQNDLTKSTERLRLGYTFPYLKKTLSDIVRREQVYLYKGENTEETLHRWTDQRIGEGSIVPQYILDYQSQNWYRVFRHGENEDTLLSHTARFVLFVFKERNKQTHLGWIRKDELEKLLVKAFNAIVINANTKEEDKDQERTKQIVESKNVIFKIIDGKLVYSKKWMNSSDEGDYTNKEEIKTQFILDYMLNMQILAEEPEGRVIVPPRTELFMNPGATTMSSESEDNIRRVLNQFND